MQACRPLLLLTLLPEDLFVLVAHALALVGLGAAIRPDLGGNLAHLALVRTLHLYGGRTLAGDLDARRDRVPNLMAEAEVQDQILALHRSAVAGAIDLHGFHKAGGNPRDHAVDQAPRGAPHGARPTVVPTRADRDLPGLDRHLNLIGQIERKLAQPAFRHHGPTLQRNLHALRNRDRILADARHHLLP